MNQGNARLDATADSHPVILFDGQCGFCNRAVRWVVARTIFFFSAPCF